MWLPAFVLSRDHFQMVNIVLFYKKTLHICPINNELDVNFLSMIITSNLNVAFIQDTSAKYNSSGILYLRAFMI